MDWQKLKKRFKTNEGTDEGPVIAIDLGTSKACVGVFQDGKFEAIENAYGNRFTPCFVSFDQKVNVGDEGKRNASNNIENTVYRIKRLIGRSYDEVEKENWEFTIVSRPTEKESRVKVQLRSKKEIFHPQEILAMIIKRMKKIAENKIGKTIEKVVISSYDDDDDDTMAIKVAASIAGFEENNVTWISDTLASAYAYVNKKVNEKSEHIMVFDLGAGCLKISVFKVKKNHEIREIFPARCNSNIGGDAFDAKLVEHFAKKLKTECEIDIEKDNRNRFLLRKKCEDAKILLSDTTTVETQVYFPVEQKKFSFEITRDTFDDSCQSVYDDITETLEMCKADLNDKKVQISKIVLVGGASRIPKVQKILLEIFKDNVELNLTVNSQESVVCGAAIYGNQLRTDKEGKKKELKSRILQLVKSDPKTTEVLKKDDNSVGGWSTEMVLKKDDISVGGWSTEMVSKKGDNSFGGWSTEMIKKSKERIENIEEEDRKLEGKQEASNNLQKVTYFFKQKFENSDSCNEISKEQKNQVLIKCDEVLEWLDKNRDASKEEYIQKNKDFFEVWNELGRTSEERKRRKIRHKLQNLLFVTIVANDIDDFLYLHDLENLIEKKFESKKEDLKSSISEFMKSDSETSEEGKKKELKSKILELMKSDPKTAEGGPKEELKSNALELADSDSTITEEGKKEELKSVKSESMKSDSKTTEVEHSSNEWEFEWMKSMLKYQHDVIDKSPNGEKEKKRFNNILCNLNCLNVGSEMQQRVTDLSMKCETIFEVKLPQDYFAPRRRPFIKFCPSNANYGVEESDLQKHQKERHRRIARHDLQELIFEATDTISPLNNVELYYKCIEIENWIEKNSKAVKKEYENRYDDLKTRLSLADSQLHGEKGGGKGDDDMRELRYQWLNSILAYKQYVYVLQKQNENKNEKIETIRAIDKLFNQLVGKEFSKEEFEKRISKLKNQCEEVFGQRYRLRHQLSRNLADGWLL